MKRFKHSLSHYKLATFDMGELVPVGCFEVLPGDSIQQATSLLLRVSPLLAPVMHPVVVRVHHWFVPNRIVWSGWEDFITGGPDGTGSAEPYPVFTNAGVISEGTVLDYLGVPCNVADVAVSALPLRAYNLIYNEFYRDQDLVAERLPDQSGQVPKVSWEKDYFTTARPWPQKGPAVSMPLGVSAPVVPTGNGVPTFGSAGNLQRQAGSANATWSAGPAGALENPAWSDPKLIADLAGASAVNVNDVRRAFALQRYQEARAQYGSRYTEYLRYLGVRSSDARLQRPEYLGGGKQTVSFSEVVRTGSESAAPIGELFGHGISAMRSRRYRRFFEEHGHVITLCSVRPRSMYVNGMHKMWNRRIKEDYWQKELEHIGQQEIERREVFLEPEASGNNDDVFGYQDRYAEYRHHPSSVSGEFRSLLDFWHLARSFAAPPVLNQDFVDCVPSKRINAEQTQHNLWVMINHSIQARRMVTRSTIGRII